MQAPTSQLHLFCDTYDTVLTAKHHVINDKLKIQITLEDKSDDKKEPIYLSLYQEEVEHLISFLRTAENRIAPRLPDYRLEGGKN